MFQARHDIPSGGPARRRPGPCGERTIKKPLTSGNRAPVQRARALYRRSIRTRLLVLLLVLALTPLALVGILAGNYGKRLLQQSVGSNFQQVARAVVSSVDQGIEQRRQAVADMAFFPSVLSLAAGSRPVADRNAAYGGLEPESRARLWAEDPAGTNSLSAMFRQIATDSPDLNEVILTDGEGWVVAASKVPGTLDQAAESWWFRAKSGGCGRSYVDDLQFDAAIGDQVAAVTVPVCRDGGVIGVLHTKLSLRQILHMVSALDLEGVAQVWIINNNGAAVAAVENRKITRVTEESAKPAASVARSIVGSRSGHLESTMAGIPSVIGYASSSGAGQFRGLGWIVLVVEPASSAYAAISRFQIALILMSMVTLVLVLLMGLRVSRTLTEPIRRSTAVAQAVARGSLSSTLPYSGQEELDSLADGLNGMTANLRRMVGSIRRSSKDVGVTSQVLTEASDRVLSGSQVQISRVAETTQLMQEADTSLTAVSLSLSDMVSATDECSDSIQEMDTNITEIVNSTESLATCTDSTLASVEQMVMSIREVDNSIDNLRELAVTTTEAVTGMEDSIHKVDSAAARTIEATERAARLAEDGEGAVESSVAGMGEIEAAVAQTAIAIRRLTGQVGKIGGILAIIRDVTEQTNLLALNAAILAAQAGEHGGGFAVVAAEIKSLAQRAAGSTKEIEGLINAVQEGAREAGQAMSDGIRHVNEGATRSREAGEALREILAGARNSTSMTHEIVDAASEHAAQSRTTTMVITRLNETISRISSVTQEQSLGCASILSASEQMREQTSLVSRAILDQKEGSRRISDSVGRVTQVARRIEQSAEHQRQLSGTVVEAMAGIGSLSQEHVESLGEIHSSVQILSQGSEELRDQVALFLEVDEIDDCPPEDNNLKLID
jgi:methyl-accepting chemotaxis protein